MPQRVFDPEKAAFHFKKADVKVPFELQTIGRCMGSAVDCASLFQESLIKANIDLTINKVSADGYWSNVWPKVPFCAVYWGRRLSADQTFSQTYGINADGTPAEWNDSKWVNDEFQKLVVEARVELDEAKRKEMYFRCQEGADCR